MSAGPAVAYFIYASVALTLTAITGRRLARDGCGKGAPTAAADDSAAQGGQQCGCLVLSNKNMLRMSRVGILFLTVGTALDNARTFTGAFPGLDPRNGASVFVTWFCTFDHICLAAIAVLVPFQFCTKGVDTPRRIRILKIVAICLVVLFLLVGVVGCIMSIGPLYPEVFCVGIHNVTKLSPTHKAPMGLLAVFAYSFSMIGCGVYFVYKRGCKSLWTVFLIANVLCIAGQATQTAFGPGYECYASNFWEQVTFISAVWGDYTLNVASKDDAEEDQDAAYAGLL